MSGIIKKSALSIICLLLLSFQNAIASEFRFSPRPNQAHLIEWKDWDEAALDEARKEDKPILLSLSAVWCHWCHVMDETTYSDPDIIDYINNNFIPIRVDSDMRPDIDSLYNQGGWPSTVILTPKGEIIDGGTYIPPEDMKIRLKRIIDLSAELKELISAGIKKEYTTAKENDITSPDTKDIAAVTHLLISHFDSKFGGFGMTQKFPNPAAIDFLLSEYFSSGKADLRDIISKTLTNMETGKIYDDIEGGFFRYSTTRDWSAPHFEKMVYDNAGIIKNYADASMVLDNGSYRTVVEKSLAYIQLMLMDGRTGRFYGSQDADDAYYSQKNRKGLSPPLIDNTTYSDGNALMISALISASAATGKRLYISNAIKTADFLIEHLYTPSGGIYHYFHGGRKGLKGMLSDNILFASALLDLYSFTGNKIYMNYAQSIGTFITETFYDNVLKRFRTSMDTTILEPVNAGMLHDYATAVVNFRTAILLNRLYYINDDPKFKKMADDILKSYKKSYERYTPATPIYGSALRWHTLDPVTIHIVAGPSKTKRFLTEINAIYLPEKVIRILTPKVDAHVIKKLGYTGGKEAVYVCHGKRCSHPLTDLKDIVPSIRTFLNIE